MSTEDDAQRARARARATWPMRKFALGQEPPDDLSALSMGERIAMVARLTADAWSFMGAELPSYSRAEMPGKVIRRGAA